MFTTIMADPPWPYEKADLKSTPAHRPNSWDSPIAGCGAAKRYPLMTVEAIAALQVKQVSAPNAHLYLWTTNSFMVEAHTVARAWGFDPKTIITWVKHKQQQPEVASMKMGYWFRSATEHVLFCVRGSLRLQNKVCLPTWFGHPRLQHSAKPDWFRREIIERASPGPYLELFARAEAPGWTVWGNEVESADLPLEASPDLTV